VEEILDFELSVCDTQPSCIGGARKEFIFSGRLDNLASSFCALRALLDTCEDAASLTDESCIRAVALFDNEEVYVSFPLLCSMLIGSLYISRFESARPHYLCIEITLRKALETLAGGV
jgi:hypothetical protein